MGAIPLQIWELPVGVFGEAGMFLITKLESVVSCPSGDITVIIPLFVLIGIEVITILVSDAVNATLVTPILTVVTLARLVPVIVIFVGVFMQYSVGPKFVIMGINWISSFSIEVPNALIEKQKHIRI